MAELSKNNIGDVTKKSLHLIADFNDSSDIEAFSFQYWAPLHKTIFINSVSSLLVEMGYQIVLNEDMLSDFNTVGKFNDYVWDHFVFLGEIPNKLREENGILVV
jgi:hypothetical protein